MKNLKLIILFFLMSFAMFAQNYDAIENTNKATQEALLYMNNAKAKSLATISTVHIIQQGQENLANVKLTSNDSEVEINQLGSENEVDLDVTALQIDATINQIGNNNNFTDYSFAPQNNYNAQINQSGNNQKIYVSGSNSLSKNVKINLKGNNKTIFVNNFQ